MKSRLILIFTCMLLAISSMVFAQNNKVSGNGKVVTKVIDITDYDQISAAGVLLFTYEQSNAAPFLEVSLDENLYDYVEIKVENRELKIRPRKIERNNRKGNATYNLQPTAFKVKSNSKKLNELNFAGSGDFKANSAVTFDDLEVNMAGSGSVLFPQVSKGNQAKLNLAGSGKITLLQLDVEKSEVNVAGSGAIKLAGNAERASYNVASSGTLDASDCPVKTASCNIAGSGDIQANASDKLSANIVGSGDVLYKGNPEVSKNVIGSGKIKQSK